MVLTNLQQPANSLTPQVGKEHYGGAMSRLDWQLANLVWNYVCSLLSVSALSNFKDAITLGDSCQQLEGVAIAATTTSLG